MAILNPAYLILGLVVGVSFVVFGFVVEQSPFLFLLIALSALLLLYLTAALINPISIVQGLVWKILYITLLAYALVRVKRAEKLKSESEYLSSK
jgi:Ca2+/Na+ antiporter